LRKELKEKLAGAERSWHSLKQKLAAAEGAPEETIRHRQNDFIRYFDLLEQVSETRKALEEAQYSTFAEASSDLKPEPAEKKELPRINNVLWVELERVKENNVVAGVVREEITHLAASPIEKDWDTAIVLSNLVEKINQGKTRYALKEVEDLDSAKKIPFGVYSSIILKTGKLLPV